MPILLSGYGPPEFKERLGAELRNARPTVVGVASAFATTGAVQWLVGVLATLPTEEVRFVGGLDNAITHPNALKLAREAEWDVRTSTRTIGVFHPKLLVGASSWDTKESRETGGICVIGSANLTMSGLQRNVEANLLSQSREVVNDAIGGFDTIWRESKPLTDESLRHYAAHFAEQARSRRPAELQSLGLDDTDEGEIPAVDVDFASVVWVGLESFTGEHTLQVEIPRDPASVLRRVVAGKLGPDDELQVLCEADATVREMTLKFYEDNQMVRLNIPNDTPDVDWVRQERQGLLVLSRGPEGGAALRLEILRPGPRADELQNRSAVLGTWGHTTTRFYGWQ